MSLKWKQSSLVMLYPIFLDGSIDCWYRGRTHDQMFVQRSPYWLIQNFHTHNSEFPPSWELSYFDWSKKKVLIESCHLPLNLLMHCLQPLVDWHLFSPANGRRWGQFRVLFKRQRLAVGGEHLLGTLLPLALCSWECVCSTVRHRVRQKCCIFLWLYILEPPERVQICCLLSVSEDPPTMTAMWAGLEPSSLANTAPC